MRKPDEIAFYAEVRRMRPASTERFSCGAYVVGAELPDATAERLGIHPNRAYRLLEKWTAKGWWEYGVSMRCGWFTPEAPQELTP